MQFPNCVGDKEDYQLFMFINNEQTFKYDQQLTKFRSFAQILQIKLNYINYFKTDRWYSKNLICSTEVICF